MSELTREQVDEQLEDIHLGSVEVRVKSMACLRRHDTAQRQRIAQLEARVKEIAKQTRMVGYESVEDLCDSFCAVVNERADLRDKVAELEAEVTRLKGRIAVDEDSHL
jgi:spore cortex formation protein SpoVR/YcgB (stage V sporulation)